MPLAARMLVQMKLKCSKGVMMKETWLVGVVIVAASYHSVAFSDVPQEPQDSFSTGSGLEEIVVTAQRRTERLQDVPLSVSATTAADLEKAGVESTQDLSLLTPGLSMPQAAGYAQPHIRGVGSSTNGPGLESPVATYIDGVYIASAPSSLFTLNNIDRVEVLKGPQGTLFGRNATGGLIQVVTKDPSHTDSIDTKLSYGNFRDTTAEVYATGGLTETLAADIAVRYERQDDAWGTNLGTGDPIGQLNHDFAGRTKFLLDPSSETQVRLALDYEDRVSSRDVQHLDQQYPGTFDSPAFGGPFPMGGPYDINNNFDPINKLKAGGAALQINQELAGLAAQSITAFRNSKFSFLLDTDLTPANVVQIYGVAKDEQFSQEFQLSSVAGGPLKWVGGIYYFYADDRWDPLDVNFGPTFISPVPGVPVSIEESDRETTNSFAGYGQATWEIVSDTNLTGGVRYTYEKKHIMGSSVFNVAGIPVATTPIPAPGLDIPTSIDFEKISYRVALDHKFATDVLGYISYNTGFKSGGYNLAVPSNPPYAPETIGAAEVGLKTEFFERRLRLNTAAFYDSYSNIQVSRFIDDNESLYNGARAKTYGVDFDGEVLLMKGFSINEGISYDHARFTSFPLADFVVPVDGCVPPLGGVCSGSAAGKTLPYAPTTTLFVGGDYATDFFGGSITLNATYYRNSGFYGAPDNVGRQAAYDLVNASITWTDPGAHYSIRLWGKNLGNTIYATSLIEADQGLVDAIGAPRTYGVTVGAKL
jgi:iron complex outermembrane recepter protein